MTVSTTRMTTSATGSTGNRVEPCAEVRDIRLVFGGHRVLDGVSFDLFPGELVLLRGENGAGKTVLLNVLSGYVLHDHGDVRLDLQGWVNPKSAGPERLARRGLGRLWQDIRLFPTMSVLENVLAATPAMLGQNPLSAVFAMPFIRRQSRIAKERALANLSLVGMADRAESSCDMLSVGQMKRVAIARLLQMQATLWLLDEPLAGLDRTSANALVSDLDCLRTEQGKTILVVEHRHKQISSIVDRTLLLKNGRIETQRGTDA